MNQQTFNLSGNSVFRLFIIVTLLSSSAVHFFYPQFFAKAIPPFISDDFANISSGLLETFTAILLLTSKHRKLGWLLFTLTMIGFLPIHIWDVFQEQPFSGSKTIAWIRLLFQFILIFMSFRYWKKSE